MGTLDRGAPPRLILVTDPVFGDDVILRCVVECARALPAGALGVQLRDKLRARESLRVFALALRAVTRREGAWLIVNGDALVARDVGADGVHLGCGAGDVARVRAAVGRRIWVSVAAHSDEEARSGARQGADALLVSPIFPTRSPSVGATPKSARGLDALRSGRAAVGPDVTIYALGGVTAERAGSCVSAGASGVAVMTALLASAKPAGAARAIHDAVAGRW